MGDPRVSFIDEPVEVLVLYDELEVPRTPVKEVVEETCREVPHAPGTAIVDYSLRCITELLTRANPGLVRELYGL